MSTEDQIAAAFTNLLGKKAYDQITIAEICRVADVSNKTLYKHFENKEAIVRHVIRQDFVTPVLALRELLPLDEIKSATMLLLEKNSATVWENRAFYKNVIKNMGRDAFMQAFTEEVTALNRRLYTQTAATQDFSDLEREFVAFYLAQSQAAIIVWWLGEHEDLSPKEVAHLFNDWGFARYRELEGDRYNR